MNRNKPLDMQFTRPKQQNNQDTKGPPIADGVAANGSNSLEVKR